MGIMMASFLICPGQIKSDPTGWLAGWLACLSCRGVVYRLGLAGEGSMLNWQLWQFWQTIQPLPATPSPSKRSGPPHLKLGFCGAGGYVPLRSGRCGILGSVAVRARRLHR